LGRFVPTVNQLMYLTFSAAASQALACLTQGPKGRDQAARLLLQGCGGRLAGYIRRHSYNQATDEDAEEILMNTVMAFVTKPIPTGGSPDAWLFTIARNELIDWGRKRNADKRGGGLGNVDLDDDEMGNLFDTALGHTELPAWVRDCIQKAAAYMQQVSPERAMVLFMVADGWSAEEIAIYFGADPNKEITSQQQAAARDRRYRAKLEAQKYFEHCKE
jgi:DNA-directed RNA polymerase specialized sigma24 family protein